RWVVIMFTSSSTTLTLEFSRVFCSTVPRPFSPGLPTWGAPLEAVSRNRLPPMACSPAGLMKSAVWMTPSCCTPGSPKTQMDAVITVVTDVALWHQDLEEAAAVDGRVQRLLGGLQGAGSEDLLGPGHTHTGTQLQTRRQLGVLGTLGTGLALDLIQQVLELGPVTLEAGSGHVGQVVGNGGEHGVLGGQSGLAYPKCCVHVLSPCLSEA